MRLRSKRVVFDFENTKKHTRASKPEICLVFAARGLVPIVLGDNQHAHQASANSWIARRGVLFDALEVKIDAFARQTCRF